MQDFTQQIRYDSRFMNTFRIAVAAHPIIEIEDHLIDHRVSAMNPIAQSIQTHGNKQTASRGGVVQLVQCVLNLAVGDLQSQMRTGDRFDRVAFVQHRYVIVGDDAPAEFIANRQVGEEQGMVNDQNLCALYTPSRAIVKTLFVGRALAPHAIARIAGNLIPKRPRRAKREAAKRSVRGFFRPLSQLLQLSKLGIIKHRSGPLARQFEPPEADVIAATFNENGCELARDHAIEQRQVLVHELLLKADGVRADDDAPGRFLFIVDFVLRP